MQIEELSTRWVHAKVPFANYSGRSPVDRGKRGVKRTILVDRNGAPLAITVGAGNRHDSIFFEEILAKIETKETPQILVADSAYYCKNFEKLQELRKSMKVVCKSID